MKKQEIGCIIADLTQKIQNYDVNLAEGFYNNTRLIDLIIELRCKGIKIDLPSVYFETPIYYELASELVRNLQQHLHPFRYWLKQHIDVIISTCIGIGALTVSIISLCV